MDPVMLSLARAGSSLALDIVILAYPIPKIAKLHITPQRKLSIALVFALGGFCCVAAAVRLAFVRKTIAIGANSKAGGFQAIGTFTHMMQLLSLALCIREFVDETCDHSYPIPNTHLVYHRAQLLHHCGFASVLRATVPWPSAGIDHTLRTICAVSGKRWFKWHSKLGS
jgi:hypothetical protein